MNPDKAAEERFKKVTVAFDIVGDPVKRKAYDRGEIDAAGDARRPTGRGPGRDLVPAAERAGVPASAASTPKTHLATSLRASEEPAGRRAPVAARIRATP